MQWVPTVRLLWIDSIRFYLLQTVNKLIKHRRRHFNVLKKLITHFALLAYVVVILREDHNTFRYWVKDDNSRHQREKVAPIFHKCQLQRKLNNSENICVDNREPQCKYRKLPLISPSPPPPTFPTPVIWLSACKHKNTSIISPLQMCGTEFDLLWRFEP